MERCDEATGQDKSMRAGSAAMRRILDEALRRITPEAARVTEAARFVRELNAALARRNILARAMVGGSAAKGTFLKGDHDVDVFVRFNRRAYGKRSAELSDLLAPALPAEAERVHGSRDYFQLQRDGLLFEIVPVLSITKAAHAANVTDVSPLHVAYVLEKLKKRPRLAADIRLAKRFCKAAKVYGAESYIGGFSGHVLDLLVIRYGGFLELLKAATRWTAPVVLDPANHHKDPLFALDKAKRLGPLILVDPIQPERNAAAALSEERFARFTDAATAFLARPALKSFTVEPLTPARVRAEYAKRKGSFEAPTRLFVLETKPLEGKEDIVATKLLLVHRRILRHARLHDLAVLDDGFEYDPRARRALHYLVFRAERLPATKEVTGPPVQARKDAARFRQKHPRAVERKGRLYAKVKRAYRTPAAFLGAMRTDPYVVERVASIRRA